MGPLEAERLESEEGPRRVEDRVRALLGARGVCLLARKGRLEREEALLRDHGREPRGLAHHGGIDLAEGREEVGEPAGAARLLLAGRGEDDPRPARRLEAEERVGHGRDAALRVVGAAAPDPLALPERLERRLRPAVAHGHRVEVRAEEERPRSLA